MSASDASPFPIKNQAFRVTFPILDADGDLVSGAASLDSEVSKDGGTFADCTNEATEIATSSGMYYLDLTATEMNADTVAVIVKSSSGKTTPLVLYPVTLSEAMLGVNQVQHSGTAQTAGDLVALLNAIDDFVDTEVAAIKAKTDNLPSDPADASDIAASFTTVNTKLDAIDDFVDTEVAAIKAVTDLLNSAQAEPTGAPAVNATPLQKIAYLFMALRNKLTVTASAKSFHDDGGAVEWSKALSDDGTTYTEAEGA